MPEEPTLTLPARVADDRRLFERYRRDADVAARDALFERFQPLAHHLARRYGGAGGHAEDLLQVASIGLLNAIDRFDPDRGIAFSSFAFPTIVGELKRYFRDKGWAVRVPRELQERALAIERAGDALERELGRPPTAAQIAERLQVSVEAVLEGRLAGSAHHGVSLDVPAGRDDDDGRTRGDQLGVVEDGFGAVDDDVTFELMLSGLGERERALLRLRFREDLTQAEIGERLGLSQMHISRLIRQSVEYLRASLPADFAQALEPAERHVVADLHERVGEPVEQEPAR